MNTDNNEQKSNYPTSSNRNIHNKYNSSKITIIPVDINNQPLKPPTHSNNSSYRYNNNYNRRTSSSMNQSWAEVCNFLSSIQLSQYTSNFKSEGFDRMDALFLLKEEDLKELQIKRGHIRILIMALHNAQKLRYNIKNPSFGSGNIYTHNEHIYRSGSLLDPLQSSLPIPVSILDQQRISTVHPPHSNTSSRIHHQTSVSSEEYYSNEEMVEDIHPIIHEKHEHGSHKNSETMIIHSVNSVNEEDIVHIELIHDDHPYIDDDAHDMKINEDRMNMELLSFINILYKTDFTSNECNIDILHENGIQLTTHWDRKLVEKRLEFLLNKDNTNYVILDMLGVLNTQLGNIQLALDFHQKAVQINPQFIEGMHNLAYLLHRIGGRKNDELSAKYYQTVLQFNANFGHCWLHYGNLLEDEGKLHEAVRMYIQAIECRPENAAFHLDLANCYDDLGEYSIAEDEYKTCIDLQPKDPVYHWNYAISLENQSKYYAAEDSYKRALYCNPQCIDTLMNYSHMLESMPTPQYRKAMKLYERVLKISVLNIKENKIVSDAQIEEAMFKCAKLYDHFGRNENAEELYMKCLQINNKNPNIYNAFGRFLSNLSRIEDANACYQAGIRNAKPNKEVQEQYIQFLKDLSHSYKSGVDARDNLASSRSSSTSHTSKRLKKAYNESPVVQQIPFNAFAEQPPPNTNYNLTALPESSIDSIGPSPASSTVDATISMAYNYAEISKRDSNTNGSGVYSNNTGSNYYVSNVPHVSSNPRTSNVIEDDIIGKQSYYKSIAANNQTQYQTQNTKNKNMDNTGNEGCLVM